MRRSGTESPATQKWACKTVQYYKTWLLLRCCTWSSNFSVLFHNSHSLSVTKALESIAGHTKRLTPQAQKRETHVSAVDLFLWDVYYCFLLVFGIRNEVLRDGTSRCVDKLIRANTWTLFLVSCYRIKPILSDQSQYSKIPKVEYWHTNSIMWKYCWRGFNWVVTP